MPQPKSRSSTRGPTLTRREFLRGTAAAGGALALASARFSPALFAQTPPPPRFTDLPPGEAPVDHVIVLMMENRSFDHYFGWLTGTHRLSYTVAADPDVESGDWVKAHLGETLETRPLAPDYRGCGNVDPDHSWDGGRAQKASGFLTTSNDPFAIGFYQESDVEFYAKLFRQFTLCDNYFCSLLGPTFPNREYMHSAQSGGLTQNRLPPEVGYPAGFTWLTIWDRLEAAGVSWAYYFVDLPAILLWGSRMAKGLRSVADFYHDALAGTLPQVAFVDPGFTTGFRTDEHPFGDIRAGQAFAHNVVKAVVESPLWARTVLFLNYDEWGGFFDHVTPPTSADDSTLNPATPVKKPAPGFEQLGFRVPCLVISPWTRPGTLATELLGIPRLDQPPAPGERFAPSPEVFYDHTSILKFIEWRFGLEPLTARDAAARNIGELLFHLDRPRLEAAAIVEALPRHLVASAPCEGEELEGVGPSTEALQGSLGRREREEQVGTARREAAEAIQQGLGAGSEATAPANRFVRERERAAQCAARELGQGPSSDGFARALECGFFETVGWNGRLPRLRDVLDPGL